MNHTPEPWSFIERGDCGAGAEADLSVEKDDALRGYLSLDDARRIVACVNACAGIPTEQIEQMRFSLPLAYYEMRKQRDELLAVLEALLDMDVSYHRGPKVEDAVSVARAAISSVKGGAA